MSSFATKSGMAYGIIARAYFNGIIESGDVLELADRWRLGRHAARRVGSTPTIPTK